MKAVLLFLIFLPAYSLIAQENYSKKLTRFGKIDSRFIPQSNINYYPLTDGDYWEFIETDTATVTGQFYESGLNFSFTKEILYDTVLSNGNSYNRIKWNNEANSVNYPPVYEYHRKDYLEMSFCFTRVMITCFLMLTQIQEILIRHIFPGTYGW